jgi:hypothetical protein
MTGLRPRKSKPDDEGLTDIASDTRLARATDELGNQLK